MQSNTVAVADPTNSNSDIPSFPVLYKKNSKGKTSKWSVQIYPDPIQQATYAIEVQFGEVDGAQQVHRTLVQAGKSNRTVLQQAILDARSKYNHKYNREQYREHLDSQRGSMDIPTTITTTQLPLPTVASPPLFSIRPMLASTFVPSKIKPTPGRAYQIPFPCNVQPKIDGIRCIAYLGVDHKVQLESRTGVPFQLLDELKESIQNLLFDVDTEHRIQPVTTKKHLIWDGELYTSDLPFETISGLVRLTRSKASDEDLVLNQKIQFHVFDVYDPRRPLLSYQERLEIVTSSILGGASVASSHGKIQMVETESAATVDDVRRMHDEYVARGFEGIILRDPQGSYEPNKRSKYLQKFKCFLEEEFDIVGFKDGVGIETGLIIFECSFQDSAGTTQSFTVRPRGTHEYRRQMFLNGPSFLGKKLTVIFQELTQDGCPRFPVGKSVRVDV